MAMELEEGCERREVYKERKPYLRHFGVLVGLTNKIRFGLNILRFLPKDFMHISLFESHTRM